MKHVKRGILGLLIIVSLYILFTPTHIFAATAKYGVKVGNTQDGFQLCDKLIVLSPNNSIMVKAKALSSELGLTYTYNSSTKKLTMATENISLVFTCNSKNFYLYYNGSDLPGLKKTAAYQCYYDSKSKSYVISIAALDNLTIYQYYKLPQSDYYAKQGYKGIYYFRNSTIGDAITKHAMITDNLVDQIVAKEITDDLSDVEKVKSLSDYMNLNCEYDDTYSNYTAYDILTKGKGVCQAYAQAYHLLVSKAGIKDYIVWGSADNGTGAGKHAWNIVKLGKDYYHVDTTWNLSNYGYFLLSDKEISVNHFWDKTKYPACKKGLGEKRFFIGKMIGDYFYYCLLDNANYSLKLFKLKYDGTDETLLFDMNFQGYQLSYCFGDNNIYFAKLGDTTSFYSFDLNNKELQEVVTDISIKRADLSFRVYKEFIYIFYKNRIISINTLTKEQKILYELIENSAVYSLEYITLNRIDDNGISFMIVRDTDSDCIIEKKHMNLDGTSLHAITS